MPSWSWCCCEFCWEEKLPGRMWCICWFKWLWLKWLWWCAPLDAEKLLWWWWLPNGWWQLHSCSHGVVVVVARWNCCCCWSRDKRLGPQPRYGIASIDEGSIDVILLSLPLSLSLYQNRITNHKVRVNKLEMMSRMWFPALEKSSSCFYLLDVYGPSLIRSEHNAQREKNAMNSEAWSETRKSEKQKINLNAFLLFHSRKPFEFRKWAVSLSSLALHKASKIAPAYEQWAQKDEMSGRRNESECRKLQKCKSRKRSEKENENCMR